MRSQSEGAAGVGGLRAKLLDTAVSLYWWLRSGAHLLILVSCLTLAFYVVTLLAYPHLGYTLSGAVLFGIFVMAGVFDLVAGPDWLAAPPRLQRTLGRSALLRTIPLLATLLIAATMLSACLLLAQLYADHWQLLLLTAAVTGIIYAAFGITAAHELIHKHSVLERVIGAFAMSLAGYGTFYREHIWGHHQDVATPADPSSARLNENIYRFFLRAIPGNLRKAWQLEAKIAQAEARSLWHWRNASLLTSISSLLMVLLFASLGGWPAALFFLVQCLFAILMLETINYAQHYGLRRQMIGDGYERVGVQHAFNSPFQLINFALLSLMRHGDHHMYAGRPYPLLRLDPKAPVFPLPLVFMLLIAFVPPLWRLLMNPRVAKAQQLAAQVSA